MFTTSQKYYIYMLPLSMANTMFGSLPDSPRQYNEWIERNCPTSQLEPYMIHHIKLQMIERCPIVTLATSVYSDYMDRCRLVGGSTVIAQADGSYVLYDGFNDTLE